MKKIMVMGMILGIFSGSTVAIEMGDLEFSGHILGGASMIRQQNRETQYGSRTGFDYAVNLDLGIQIDEKLSAFIELQSSPGNGHLGFPGPGTELTDAQLIYDYSPQTEFTLGSFDLPFGTETNYLTNNANSFSSWFLSNDLLYSVLAGPLGTLNTVGLKGDHQFDTFSGRWVLSNGTDESARNEDSGFLVLFGAESDQLLPGFTLGTSAFRVDESGNVSGNNFKSELTGLMFDASKSFSQGFDLRTYIAFLNFGDGSETTEDEVSTWMVALKKSFGTTFVSARFSAWIPNDGDGNGSGISSDIPTAGFGTTQGEKIVVSDQNIYRLQLGMGHFLEKNVLLRGDLVWDDYSKKSGNENTDTFAVLAFVNVSL